MGDDASRVVPSSRSMYNAEFTIGEFMYDLRPAGGWTISCYLGRQAENNTIRSKSYKKSYIVNLKIVNDMEGGY